MPAGVALVVLAERATARIAVAIYVVSLTALFGTSAAYHRMARSSTAKRRLRRLDHSMIYVLIAGTYTPLCVLALPAVWGIPVLAAVWGAATAGVVVKAADIQGLVGVADALYLILGWAVIVALPVLIASVPASGLVLMVTGGIAYTVGAVGFLRGRPDPRPNVSDSTRSGTPAPSLGRSATSPWCGSSSPRRRTLSPGSAVAAAPATIWYRDGASSGAVVDVRSVRQLAVTTGDQTTRLGR